MVAAPASYAELSGTGCSRRTLRWPCVASGAMSSMADDEWKRAIGQWWWVPCRTLETADRGHGPRFAQSMGATGQLFWTAQRRYLGRVDEDQDKARIRKARAYRRVPWPRGLSKDDAALDLWAKDVAPSSMLRSWFAHREDRFADFTARYVAELDKNPAVDELFAKMRPYTVVTLLFGARDPRLNQAVVLADYLRGASARIS